MKRLIEEGESHNTAEFYNEIFPKRFEVSGLDLSQPIRANLLLNRFKGGRFLEVGCGMAPHCLLARSKPGSEIWGLDLADTLIEKLKKEYRDINYIVGDGNNLPFKDDYFDYLVIGEFLEHMEDPEKTLTELFRVIKKGGVLALSVPNRDSGAIAPLEHIWSYEEKDIRELLSKFGETETFILDENNHQYIIGYATKK